MKAKELFEILAANPEATIKVWDAKTDAETENITVVLGKDGSILITN